MPWVARWREPGLQAEQEKRQLAGRLTTLLELRLRGG
jgi:phenylpyruvate tautomerase PptA (4-oxalocrotonate tautomerase family)